MSKQIPQGALGDCFQAGSSWRANSSHRANTTTVIWGLDDDLASIKNQLTCLRSELVIVSVSGMGGIGKTTLTKMIYDDPDIGNYFDVMGWTTVSQEFNVTKVLLGILGFVANSEMDDLELAVQVYKRLKCRRYLIVIDDMWSTEVWDGMYRFFPDDENGSRIIVTTRLVEVADYVKRGCSSHQMSLISEDHSLKLLKLNVFGNEYCPFELEKLAKDIAQQCHGLPLAIKVIAGLLSEMERTVDCWMNVARNIRSIWRTKPNHMLDLLALSYNHLPHHLKACFLYLLTFPEDLKISVSKLIMLWIAEGLAHVAESKGLEEVAEEYVQDLVARNLVLVVKRRSNGRVKTCSIHDLMRDVLLREAKKEDLKHLISSAQGVDFHFLPTFGDYIWPLNRISSHRLHNCNEDLTQLINLTYLEIALDDHDILPASLYKLCHLQTLICCPLRHAVTLALPKEIWTLTELRNLRCKGGCYFRFPITTGVEGNSFQAFPNMQSICEIDFGSCCREVFVQAPTIRKLGLRLRNDDDIFSKPMSSRKQIRQYLNNLKSFKCLETLKCAFDSPMPAPLLGSLPTTLKQLTLTGRSRRPWKETRLLTKIPNLEVLKVKNYAFQGDHWRLKDENCFDRLKFLGD